MQVGISDRITLALIVHEVKQLVFFDWAAERAAKLLERNGLFCRGARGGRGAVIRVEVIPRIENGIAAISVA